MILSSELEDENQKLILLNKLLLFHKSVVIVMAQDAFYMLDNDIILNRLNNAINVHQNWLNTLKEIIFLQILALFIHVMHLII